jgi:MFS family permease
VLTTFAVETLGSLVLTALVIAGVGGIGAIFLVITIYGACRAFEQPAMHSWLPTLVSPAGYPRAAAANSLVSQAAVIVGPALGGFVYLLGPSVPFFAAALLQSAGLICALTLPVPRRSGGEKLSWNALLGGVRFIARTETVRGAISLDLFCVLFGGAVALLPIFARDILHIGPAGLGFLRSAPALGALITGIVLTRRPPQRKVGPRMMIAVAIYGAATLVFGVSTNLWLSLAALVAVGGADMLSVVIRSTLVQVVAPNAIRGRVAAVNSLFTGASNQLGQFESGVTAAWFGPVGSVVLGGVATILIVALWSRWFPALRFMDRLVPEEAAVDRPRAEVSGSPHPLRGR